MKAIIYRLFYMLSGMFLLMALATFAIGKFDWQWLAYMVCALFVAENADRETKAPPR